MSATDFYHELQVSNKHIISQEHYDKYPLIFRHYKLDQKIVRIGMNENQKEAANKRSPYFRGGNQKMAYSKYNFGAQLWRKRDSIQQSSLTDKVTTGQDLLN